MVILFMWLVLVYAVVCCRLHEVGQSCTGDAVPRVVNMHGVRVVYMYEEGDKVIVVLSVNGLKCEYM